MISVVTYQNHCMVRYLEVSQCDVGAKTNIAIEVNSGTLSRLSKSVNYILHLRVIRSHSVANQPKRHWQALVNIHLQQRIILHITQFLLLTCTTIIFAGQIM